VTHSLTKLSLIFIDLSWHKGIRNTDQDAEVYLPQLAPNGLIKGTLTRSALDKTRPASFGRLRRALKQESKYPAAGKRTDWSMTMAKNLGRVGTGSIACAHNFLIWHQIDKEIRE
jgi:hypothetical protein